MCSFYFKAFCHIDSFSLEILYIKQCKRKETCGPIKLDIFKAIPIRLYYAKAKAKATTYSEGYYASIPRLIDGDTYAGIYATPPAKDENYSFTNGCCGNFHK